jgi:hypothetical protein
LKKKNSFYLAARKHSGTPVEKEPPPVEQLPLQQQQQQQQQPASRPKADVQQLLSVTRLQANSDADRFN